MATSEVVSSLSEASRLCRSSLISSFSCTGQRLAFSFHCGGASQSSQREVYAKTLSAAAATSSFSFVEDASISNARTKCPPHSFPKICHIPIPLKRLRIKRDFAAKQVI
ncbi:hypothetical protein GOP47_0004221 [Adiantum capillus-veneris]|uniref:Uncharacterized protein n=1 Tax=Adiantum capillus-veneris TaxID=13818 RepID=A0A9D4ZME2_ADICA|nr:hypothetical protein GOP47_0004221 [Adiantum capillus-veneris]